MLDFLVTALFTIGLFAFYIVATGAILAVIQMISLKVFRFNLFKKFWNTLDKLDKITS